MKTHRGKRAYTCNINEHAFNHQGNSLSSHMITHSGEMIFTAWNSSSTHDDDA